MPSYFFHRSCVCILWQALHYVCVHCVTVTEVCVALATLNKMDVWLLSPGTRGHKFTICLVHHFPASLSSPPFFLPSLPPSFCSLHNPQSAWQRSNTHRHASTNAYRHDTRCANVNPCHLRQDSISLAHTIRLRRRDWPARVPTPVYTWTHMHKNTHTHARSNTLCAVLPPLSCLAGIISSSSAKGSKVSTAWQCQLYGLPLFSGFVCVCVCARPLVYFDNVTTLIKFASLEFSSLYTYTAYISRFAFTLFLYLPAAPFLLAHCGSLLFLFFFLFPSSHIPLTFCLPPSLHPLGTD